MSAVIDAIVTAWSEIVFAISNIRFFDIVDIVVVAYVAYKCIELFRETRSGQVFKGIIILMLLYLFAKWFDMVTVNWILVKVLEYGIVALAVVFQPEIRRALEKMGRSNLGNLGRGQSFEDSNTAFVSAIDAISKACGIMQEQKTGALIVFERSTLLGEISDTGTVLDAAVSTQLIGNIFFTKSPLHDGAVIVREGRILAAGCILPLTAADNLASHLGTRHRAAIGMSENSDAVVVVVSEETGTISLADDGKLERNLTPITLRELLKDKILPKDDAEANNQIFAFVSKIGENVTNGVKNTVNKLFKKGAKTDDKK